jgi:hypothetical protein
MHADDPPGLAVTIPLRGRWWFEAKWVTLGKVGKRVKDEVGQVGGFTLQEDPVSGLCAKQPPQKRAKIDHDTTSKLLRCITRVHVSIAKYAPC